MYWLQMSKTFIYYLLSLSFFTRSSFLEIKGMVPSDREQGYLKVFQEKL